MLAKSAGESRQGVDLGFYRSGSASRMILVTYPAEIPPQNTRIATQANGFSLF
jgi:hypothetical protein